MGTSTGAGSGVAVWRVIAEELRRDIVDGRYPSGSKMPTEAELTLRFGVHRNTVRQAIAALADDGLVEPRRGSGTYVTDARLMKYRIGTRTRLSTSLSRDGGAVAGRVLSSVVGPVPSGVDARLGLDGADGVQLKTLRLVDDVPVARATHWFAATGADALVAALERTGSITATLQAIGIDDYIRAETVIGARIASSDEAADLEIGAGAVVLVARSLDTLPDGTPLQFSVTRFPAERIEFDVDHAALGALR